MTEGYANFVDNMKKLPKKTSHITRVKNYDASKAQHATLKNQTSHLPMRQLGPDASK